jgi:Thioesterase-like superfamily
MSVGFRTATEVVRSGANEFAANVPESWLQGRGVFGGLLFGTLLRAARAHEADPQRILRSFACDVAAPVLPGPVVVAVHELRRGRNQTNLQLELHQAGRVAASALCTLSTVREGSAPALAAQAPPEAHVLPTGEPDLPRKGAPQFASNYEFWSVGPEPLARAPEALVMSFVRERGQHGELDPAAFSALLDCVWPAIYSVAPRLFPVTTVSYNAQFFADRLSTDEPLFYRARALTQHEGYSVEFRELWTRDRLLALNQQTFAVLG